MDMASMMAKMGGAGGAGASPDDVAEDDDMPELEDTSASDEKPESSEPKIEELK
jgi:hypothetical protein